MIIKFYLFLILSLPLTPCGYAARMESNGKEGMIQVSPSTAERLTRSGKGKWLLKREDTIVAKGIGEMTTYWVKVSSESLLSASASGCDTQDSEENLSPLKEETTKSCSVTKKDDPVPASPNPTSNRNHDNKAPPPKSTMQHILSM
jgi:hypothetical protein